MNRPRPDDFETWEEYENACEQYQEALEEWANFYHDEQLIESYYG